MAFIVTSSKSSTQVTWTPLLSSSTTVRTAASTVGNDVVATFMGSLGASRTVHSVTMPSVLREVNQHQHDSNDETQRSHPSAPINSLVVSQPIALFLARDLVLRTLPDGRTTVALTMYSPFMLPNRTAAVPDPPHPITASIVN